jgi:hypothetical protein
MSVPTRPGDRIERRMSIGSLEVLISAGLHETERPQGWVSVFICKPAGAGSLSHTFGNIGDQDWRAFLSDLDADYVGDKFFGNARFEPDFRATCSRIRGMVNELRREDVISVASAEGIRRHVGHCMESFRSDPLRRESERHHVGSLVEGMRRHGFDDVGGLARNRLSRSFTRFIDRAWAPLAAALRAELALDREPEDAPAP